MVKIRKANNSTYNHYVTKRGPNAVFITVDGTKPGETFPGLFTDDSKTEIVVMWPLQYTKEIQEEFVKEYGDIPESIDLREYETVESALDQTSSLLTNIWSKVK